MVQVGQGLLVLVIFVILARVLRSLISRLLDRRHVAPELVILTREAVYFTVLVVAVLLAVFTALNLTFLAVSGFLGALLLAGLGLQQILQNYVAGFYLLIERNVRVGDTIELDGKAGVVTDVRLRVTYLRQEDGSTIIVPNLTLFTSAVTRHTAPASPAPPG